KRGVSRLGQRERFELTFNQEQPRAFGQLRESWRNINVDGAAGPLMIFLLVGHGVKSDTRKWAITVHDRRAIRVAERNGDALSLEAKVFQAVAFAAMEAAGVRQELIAHARAIEHAV